MDFGCAWAGIKYQIVAYIHVVSFYFAASHAFGVMLNVEVVYGTPSRPPRLCYGVSVVLWNQKLKEVRPHRAYFQRTAFVAFQS